MKSHVDAIAKSLRMTFDETWEHMEREFKLAFSVALGDVLPELTTRFSGADREPGGRYQALLDEVLMLEFDGDDSDFPDEPCDMQPPSTEVIEAFLAEVSPKSTYNFDILRSFMDCWHLLQLSQDYIEHAQYSDAVYFLSQANLYLGSAAAISSCRDVTRNTARAAGLKRHEEAPVKKDEILEKYRKEISPKLSASQAALKLRDMGVLYNIDSLTRLIRQERKRLLSASS